MLAASARGQLDEYQVKAAFIYNFAKFVEWPQQPASGAAGPMALCVLGQDPFGGALEDVVSGKVVNGRALVVRQVRDVQHSSDCHILFVSASERKRIGSILEVVRGKEILTIGDMERFAAEGGVINLKLEDGRIRIEINLEAAHRQSLRISSKLLNLAEIVK
jgi:hypothetical protein